ncbi:wall surface anchor family domain protein, partial [Chlamydia psittaci 06-1683]
TKPLELLLSRL